MGKSAGSAKQRVAEYRMSYHLGLGHTVDAVVAIYIGEKEAWTGNQTAEGAISISRPDLFGGPKKEGGVGGLAYFLPGGPTQVMPAGLAARRGLTSSTHPGYRGVSSLYFVGSMSPGSGFMWGATPYMQSVWVRVRRAPKGLNPTYRMIGNQSSISFVGYTASAGGQTTVLTDGVAASVGGNTLRIDITTTSKTYTINGVAIVLGKDSDNQPIITVAGTSMPFSSGRITVAGVTVEYYGANLSVQIGSAGEDANPAHIIYECLTNTDWGMGAPTSIIDLASFEAAGRTLFNEGFGLSLQWTKQTTIQAFIGEIVDHIQGAVYVDPATGKFTLKLLRDDFDADSLPIIGPENAELTEYQRKTWGETASEMVVTWTNPVNEQEETVTSQELATISMQGGVVSDSRNYYGVRNAQLAKRLADRDVTQSSTPLASAKAKVNRSQWNLRPGSVVRLTWPEYNIISIICRVTDIDYGKIGDPSITLTLLEDIFSVDLAAYIPPPDTGWEDPSEPPEPADSVRVITAPAYLTTRRLTAADAEALAYPEVLANILAATTQQDAAFYRLMGQTVLPNGDTVAEDIGDRPLLGVTVLDVPLAAEASTLLASFPPTTGNQGPTLSGFLFIGDTSEFVQEIALIESFSEDGWVLRRGVLDTVPRAWPAGTKVWFYDIRNEIFDPDIRSEGEQALYKLLVTTSKGQLSIDDAPTIGSTLTARPHLPNRPANVIVGGVGFGGVDLSGASPTVIPVTWANRNRTMEEPVLRWTDATMTPEAGQTTTIRVVKKDGTVLTTHSGLTGTGYNIPVASFAGVYEADVQVSSARDGLESLQFHSVRVRVAPAGYGDDYGGDYGGGGTGSGTVSPPPVPSDPVPPVDPGTDFPSPWRPPTSWQNPIQ